MTRIVLLALGAVLAGGAGSAGAQNYAPAHTSHAHGCPERPHHPDAHCACSVVIDHWYSGTGFGHIGPITGGTPLSIYGRPVSIPSGTIRIKGPPIYVNPPPIHVQATRIEVEYPDVYVNPSVVTVDQPTVSFPTCEGRTCRDNAGSRPNP